MKMAQFVIKYLLISKRQTRENKELSQELNFLNE